MTTLAQASATAVDGDTVEIDPGVYYGGVASWRQNNLTIRGVGGRPVLDAGGTSAQGKGIFVISGSNVTVENLEFVNARVPDRNGAGIRMEGARLTVRNSVFRGNETSILTLNNPNAVLEVFDSQFISNGFASAGGQMHGIYVNQIGRFVVQGSYFSRTEIGHLIKSRARENHILYNRITDDSQSAVSYEVDLPNGGIVYLIGNLIEQSARTDNPVVVGYGEEGLFWGTNQLHAVNNTFVNRRSGSCTWIWAPRGGAVRATNNLLLGNCGFLLSAGGDLPNNRVVTDADFVNTSVYDFRLRGGSAALVPVADPGWANGLWLRPVLEHRFPSGTASVANLPLRLGAYQTPQ